MANNMNLFAHQRCYVCGDTWCRDLDALEASAYMQAHPEIDFSEVSDITLGDVMCDGCEDDLAELRAEDAAIDRSWEAYYQNLQEGETGED